MRKKLSTYLLAVCLLAAMQSGTGEAAVPDIPVLQLAAQQYPGYIPLLLPPTTTSSINAALRRAVQQQQQQTDVPPAVVVILRSSSGSSSGGALTVDVPIAVSDGISLAITTPAAMAAAAAGAAAAAAAAGAAAAAAADRAGPRVAAGDLLRVRCGSSKGDGFIKASGAGDIRISGLSVQGCPGSAIEVDTSRSLTVTNTEFVNNNLVIHNENGGAILAVELQQVTLDRVLCSRNYALTKGGCLYATNLADGLTVKHSVIQYNWKDDPSNGGGGAGIYTEAAAHLIVAHSTFAHNTALGTGSNGGGINAQIIHDHMVVEQCTFMNNSAALEGGGFAAWDVAELHVRDTTFTRNGLMPPSPDDPPGSAPYPMSSGAGVALTGTRLTATAAINATMARVRFINNTAETGGGITGTQWGIGRGRLEVVDCLFYNNQGDKEAGGVFYNENFLSDVIIRRSNFTLNYGQYGGAVSVYDSNVMVEDSNFTSNWATADGGALQLQTNMGMGAGNSMTVTRSTFTNNTSGALGGAIAVDSQDLVIEDCLIVNNNATAGGGGVSVMSASEAVFRDVMLMGNTAIQKGGGVKLQEVGRLVIKDVTVERSQALTGDGGGLHLDRVESSSISNLTLQHNTAKLAGGAAAMLQADQMSWSNSVISNNQAQMGGGLAADSSVLEMRDVVIANNTAGTVAAAAAEGGGGAEGDELGGVLPFASVVYVTGTAGAAVLQRSVLEMADCKIADNRAGHDAGALLVQQPMRLSINDTTFEANTADTGVGGALVIRGPGKVAVQQLRGCSFRGNIATGGNGGGIVLDSGLGVLEVECDDCEFDSNISGQDGGGVAATGPTLFTCTNCLATNNTASHSGGWFSCGGCDTASLATGLSINNTAAAAGGAVNCEGCTTFSSHGYNYTTNSAAAGGAVAVQSATLVKVTSSTFDQNSATAPGNLLNAAAEGSKQLLLVNRLPPTWQLMYGVGSAAVGSVGCSSGGSGGGLCVGSAAAAQLTDLTLTDNKGSTGGAVFASAACNPAAATDSSSSCQLDLVNLTAVRNVASEAGGALYSSTPDAITLSPAGGSATGDDSQSGVAESQAFTSHQQNVLLQQLAADNTVAQGGYGSGAASFPARLSLMDPAQISQDREGVPAPIDTAIMSGTSSNAVSKLQQQQQQQSDESLMGAHGRRLHQLFGQSSGSGGSSLKDTLLDVTRNVVNKVSSAEDASLNAGVEFEATCPPLGATVLEPTRVGVDSFQIFSLPVYILDAFGSRVSSGPGADWLVTLYQPSSSGVQLSGAARGRLKSGSTVLDGLTLSAPSGNAYNMTLSAVQGQSSSGQPLNSTLRVEVRPCLPGQRAEFANGTTAVTPTGAAISSSYSSEITCRMCPAPSFSFSAYGDTPAAAQGTCPACPARGICVAGVVWPAMGCYQPHPRSATIHACPHTKACSRDINAMQNLQGLQCANRAYLDPRDVDGRPFEALQCSRGYAGPFCSVCYRPGRNAWLTQQWQQQQVAQQQQRQQPGYTVAGQPPVLVKPWSKFDPLEVFGQSNRRCARCPHPALAWLGFLLARVVDMLLIALLALVWLGFGWLSQSPAAGAFEQLKKGKFKGLTLRHSILGPKMSNIGSGSLKRSGDLKRSGEDDKCKHGPQHNNNSSSSKDAVLTAKKFSMKLRSVSGSGSPRSSVKSPKAAAAAAAAGHRVTFSGDVADVMPLSPFFAHAHHNKAAAAAGHDPSAAAQQHTTDKRGFSRVLAPLTSILSSRSGSGTLPNPPAATAASGSLSSKISSRLGSGGSRQTLRGYGSRTLSRTLTGFYNLSGASSMRWSSATQLVHTQQQQKDSDGDEGAEVAVDSATQEVRLSALLLMAVTHLACLVQVILDAAQIAAVLLSLDLVFFLPDWAASGLSAVLITQANTWQWMAFDCLLPGHSQASAAVVQAVLVLVLPVLYSAVLFPIMSASRRKARQYILNTSSSSSSNAQHIPVSTSAAGSSLSSSSTLAAVPSSRSCRSSSSQGASKDQSLEPLELSPFAAAAAASGTYTNPVLQIGTDGHYSSVSVDYDGSFVEEIAQFAPKTADSRVAILQQQQQQGVYRRSASSVTNGTSSSPAISKPSLWARFQAWWGSVWPPSKQSWVLITSIFVASMAYSFSFYVSNVVSAFSCMALAGKPTLPGEIHLTGSYWVPDMQMQCWRGSHTAVVVLTTLIGVPMLLGYLFLLLVLAWPAAEQQQEGQQQPDIAVAPAAAVAAVPQHIVMPVQQLLLLPVTRVARKFMERVPWNHTPAPPAAARATTAAAATEPPVQQVLHLQPSATADASNHSALPLLPSQRSAATAAGTLTPALSTHSSFTPPPLLIANSSSYSDHFESEFGPFAMAAVAEDGPVTVLDTALPPVSEHTPHTARTAAVPAGGAVSTAHVPRFNQQQQQLGVVRSAPTNWTSNNGNGMPAAAAAAAAPSSPDVGNAARLFTPGGRPGYVETPGGLISSQSLVVAQRSSSFTGAVGLLNGQSHSSSTGNHPQPDIIESPSGQLMLQTQFGLVPVGSGLVETPLGLKHTRSGRLVYNPQIMPGMTSLERSGGTAVPGAVIESETGPIQPRSAQPEASQPHHASLALSGPDQAAPLLSGNSRLLETPSGPVVLLPAAAAVAAGTPAAVPMALQVGSAVPAAAPPSPSSSSSSGNGTSGSADQHRARRLVQLCSAWIRAFVLWFVSLPAQILEPPVRSCQRRWAHPAGVTGESCAGLEVWNGWCWYWLPMRELVKAVTVVAAAATAMRAPQVQALVLLLLVILTAAGSWRVQAGCSTSMNRMLYAAHCWLQLLVLLVLLMTLQGLNADAYGAVLLGVVVLVMAQCGVLLGCLVWRCCTTARELSEAALQQQGSMQPAAANAVANGRKDVFVN